MSIVDLDMIRSISQGDFSSISNKTLVACLCADWCSLCRKYMHIFYSIDTYYPQHCFVWIDIEECSDKIDVFNIENFPNIIIEDSLGIRFNGPLLPNKDILIRLIGEYTRLPILDDYPSLWKILSDF